MTRNADYLESVPAIPIQNLDHLSKLKIWFTKKYVCTNQ